MKKIKPNHLIFSLVLFVFTLPALRAQQWQLEKDKDGIKVYTRPEPGSKFNAFKGETEVQGDLEAVIKIIEDVEQFDDWDEDVKEIRVLEHDPGKMLKYYVVYDLPWPIQDRDLCIEAVFSFDEENGNKLLVSRPIPDAVPANEDLVRIIDYWQQWILEPKENGMVHITVEGFADPAGDIPAWIANMAITDTPLNMLKEIRNKFN
jgi:hypothetical protein